MRLQESNSTGPVCSEFADIPQVAAVLAEYVAGLAPHVAMLDDALNRGTFGDLRRLAHQLHGTGGSYGFPQVSTLAADAESAINRGDKTATIAADVRRLVDLVRRIEGYDRSRENLPRREAPSLMK